MATTNGANGTNGTRPAKTSDIEKFLEQKYDFVIAGGGVAGLTVAARLSENPDVTVGVIEAGKNKLGDMLVDTPAMFLQMFNNPEYDWAFKTTPQVRLSDHGIPLHVFKVPPESEQRQGPPYDQRQDAWWK